MVAMPEPRDPIQEMHQRYRNVFSTAEGRYVLGDILTRGHYGVTLDPENQAQIAEYNSAIIIAHIAGAFDEVYHHLGMIPKEK